MLYRLCRGQAILMSQCWARFQELCLEHSVPIPYYYKSRRAFFSHKLTQMIPDITIIPRQGTDLEDDIIISASLFLVQVINLINNDSTGDVDFTIPAYNQNEMMQMVHV